MKYQGISILKRPHCNTWYARYRSGGKQFYVSARTQQECYNKLKLALKNKNKQLLLLENTQQTKLTFAEWYQEWLETFKFNMSDSTKRDYRSSYNKLSDLYELDITQITNIIITKVLNKIDKARMKQKTYELLDMLFNKALLSEKISKNPMIAVDKPSYKRKNGDAFKTPEEEQQFIENCKKQNLDLFLVALYQGLRHGELLAITDKDIDFEKRTLDINKSLTQNGKFGPTKNNSDRIQPIFDKTYEILLKYKNVKGRIFKQSYKLASKLFKQALVGLPNQKYTIKTLRFTFITRCEEKNIPEHIIQAIVGHEIGSPVTKQTYTKVRESAINHFVSIINT